MKEKTSLVFKKQNTRNAMKMQQCYLIKQHKKILRYKILHFIHVWVFMQLNAVSPQYWNYLKQNTAYPTALKKRAILML